MSSLTGNDEVLTKTDLENYHARILPYLNGVTCIDNTFDTSNLYSTEEKMIGQWVDGKPLYQKAINVGAINKTTTTQYDKTVALNISGLENTVNAFGYVKNNTNGACFIIPGCSETNIDIGVFVYNNTLYIRILGSVHVAYDDCRVIIQYTKTTDSAMTVPFGSVNEYSLTERIVGTWIDGKPIYQKTVSCGALPNKSSTITVTDIDNLKNVITLNGIATAQNYILPLPYVVYAGSAAVDVYIDKSTSVNIVIRTGVDQSSYTQSFITIQYTKTTD